MLQVGATTLRLVVIICCYHTTSHRATAATASSTAEALQALQHAAFCKTGPVTNYFPTDLPEVHLPWIWDAVHDPQLDMVEIMAVPRQACSFNESEWQLALHIFPHVSKQLAGGFKSNVFVRVEDEQQFDFIGKRNPAQGIYDKQVVCAFYKDGFLVQKTVSHTIRGDLRWRRLSMIQIRCPTPSPSEGSLKSWDHVKLERDVASIKLTAKHHYLYENETIAFPACELPPYDKNNKQFFASVCTAIQSGTRSHIVEWVEYHLLLGVEHFFIYCTATKPGEAQQMRVVLRDYIALGIVTVVDWPYHNCARGFASGRSTWWASTFDRHRLDGLQPPRPIAQIAALASCYSRFKHTTKYLIHIDMDEFIFINGYSLSSNRRSDQQQQRKGNDSSTSQLMKYLRAVYKKRPDTPAIYIKPIDMLQCPMRDEREGLPHLRDDSNALPRLNHYSYGYISPHNGKLIIRTDFVGLFYVHYVTVLDGLPEYASANGEANDRTLISKARYIALMHFKPPPHVSGDIFGTNIVNLQLKESKLCSDAFTKRLLGDAATAQITDPDYFQHHLLSSRDILLLSEAYKRRIASV